ncbi:MAG: hypothetical protein ACI82G_000461, partial [Bradymonadia bacterium]
MRIPVDSAGVELDCASIAPASDWLAAPGELSTTAVSSGIELSNRTEAAALEPALGSDTP